MYANVTGRSPLNFHGQADRCTPEFVKDARVKLLEVSDRSFSRLNFYRNVH